MSLCTVDALADSIRLSDRGVRVNMVPDQHNGKSDHSIASATCNVRVNQRQVMLHFAATPFVHVDDSRIKNNAMLSATVSRQLGQIVVSPQAIADRTNISNDDEQATIAVGVSGNGRAQVQLQVGIDANNAHAGRHCTTVVMTVTAN
ncbi:hypothetical protein [Rubripirellula obstinata]|nr:hypothetical protein [Rubripirellula obstinata]